MKYLIILFNITLIIFSIQIPVSASIEVHGEVSFKYDLEGQGELWTIDLNNEVKEDWILGTKLITSTDGYGTCFNIIPAFIPTSQLYEVYITYKVTDQLSFTVSQWCNHPVYSGNLIDKEVSQGIYFEGKFKF